MPRFDGHTGRRVEGDSIHQFDAASQLTSLVHQLSGSPVASSSYTYDAVGNRTSLTDLDGAHNFVYDTLNRLDQATHSQPSNPPESFAYDPVGNRTGSHLATGQIHDVANRLLEDSNFTYTYDTNGNLVEKIDKGIGDRTVYTYDAENQLIRVDLFTLAGGTTPVTVADYRYDALGRRIEKDVNGVIARYIYDNEDIIAELDGGNIVRATYIHGPGIDEPLAVGRFGVGGGTFTYHADGLGSITTLTDAFGTPVRTYTYDSFGQIVDQTGTVTNPYTYTGREFDPETGLYYYRARYYDPHTGRYMKEDPLGIVGGSNLYVYANNRPTIFIDPNGLLLLGVTGTATSNAGLVYGAAGDVGGFAGIKINKEGVGFGAFGSGGAFIGGPGAAIGMPGGKENKGGVVIGGNAGFGLGVFFSNASSFADLEGTFQTFQLNLPLASFQLDIAGDTFVFSLSAGPTSPTASFTTFTTVTPQELIVETRSERPSLQELQPVCQ